MWMWNKFFSIKMNKQIKKIKKIASTEYKYGFTTNIEEERIPNGINIDIIKTISKIKKEPKWLLDWRIKAYKKWIKMA